MPVQFLKLVLRRGSMSVAAVAGLCVAVPAYAQNAKVYVANSANSRIQLVNFSPLSTTVINNDPNLLTKVRDIAIRDDGLSGAHLLVCDRNGGRIAFYANSVGSAQFIYDASVLIGPERPDGMSLDLAGNIFVMNSGQGSSGGVSQVWAMKRDPGCPNAGRPECLNGGYRAPLGLIDPNVRISTQFGGVPTLVTAELLPESLVAQSGGGLLSAGDLLVITNPGALIRYPAQGVGAAMAALAAGQVPAPVAPDTIIHPAGASVPLDRQFPVGAVPNGMAFGPTGELLIPVGDGRILIYGADGRRKSNGAGGFVDFATSGGQDEYKIAIGLQNGSHRALVTHQQRGELRRYTFNTDGTGTLDTVLPGFQFPVGVDVSNSTTVAAPAGPNVSVDATSVMSVKIEQVLLPGLVNAKVSTFPDPRESEQTIAPNLPLHRSLFLNELRADFPAIEIPAWARAFRIGNPTTGTPSFIIIEAQSNLVVTGLLDHLALESPILGYNPNCADPDITKQPFLFWAPDANDAPIVEGTKFIDVTTGCSSIRGLTRDLSYFIAGVRITQPMRDLSAQKLASLRQVITGSTCIANSTRRALERQMDRIDRDFVRNRYPQVIQGLQSLEAEVLQSPQAFTSCTVNTAGEIRARARSASFALGKI